MLPCDRLQGGELEAEPAGDLPVLRVERLGRDQEAQGKVVHLSHVWCPPEQTPLLPLLCLLWLFYKETYSRAREDKATQFSHRPFVWGYILLYVSRLHIRQRHGTNCQRRTTKSLEITSLHPNSGFSLPVYNDRHWREVFNMGADQERVRIATTQPQAKKNNHKLHHRSTRANQSWEHMFYELYCPGTYPHSTAARFLPLRQAQM